MADLFAGLEPDALENEEPDQAAVADLVSRRNAAIRKQTRLRGLIAVAWCSWRAESRPARRSPRPKL